jgi:CAAX protease family protein
MSIDVLELASPTKSRPWKFWATNLWVGAALVAFLSASSTYHGVIEALSKSGSLSALESHPLTKAAGWLVPLACAFGVIALAIRLSGMGIRQYLGLIPPRPRDIGLGLAGLVVIFFAYAFGLSLIEYQGPPNALNLHRQMQASGLVLFSLWQSVVVAPVVEEILFRGFLFRGWADSWIGPAGAVALTSALWMVGHTDRPWPFLVYIFCIGLLYGAIRAWHGSTTTTLILHLMQNAFGSGYLVVSDALHLLPDA